VSGVEELPAGVAELIPAYLGRQRWYAGSSTPDPDSIRLLDAEELATTGGGAHRLLWAMVEAEGARYQLLVGERQGGEPAEFLNGHEPSVFGSAGDAYYYDATLDPELARALLAVVTGRDDATRVRPVSAEQSNTSLVFDDRIILKVFRRLVEGANPDVEVTEALVKAGFQHVAKPLASWNRDGVDLAFAQDFLAGGSEGWALALTSLRDFYGGDENEPGEAGGDFAAEARRLGQMTAQMHLAMATAFGVVRRDDFRGGGWPAVVAAIAARIRDVVGAAGSADTILERLRAVNDPGPAVRVHGDYHLGQVMRTDTGWYVLDFEGEPARPIEERLAPSSAMKDVTAMLRSFQYAAHFVLLEREDRERASVERRAEAWEAHNRSAFLEGYFRTPGIDDLLPGNDEDRSAVMLGFELDKALYEVAYEEAYRPGWVEIPRTAIRRILSGSVPGPVG
jgi:maltokinase